MKQMKNYFQLIILQLYLLSENLQYFLNDMNIYAEYVDYDSVTAENIANLVRDKGIKVVISDRWLKKNVIKALKDVGGEFVIINTLDIPMDKDGKMDPEAILKAFKENTDNLIEALKKIIGGQNEKVFSFSYWSFNVSYCICTCTINFC